MYICECDPPWLRVEPDTEFLATLIWTLLKTTIYRATNFPFFFLQGGIIWLAPVLCTKVNVTNRIPQHKFSQPSSLDVIGDALLFVGYICFQYCEPNTTGSELLFLKKIWRADFTKKR